MYTMTHCKKCHTATFTHMLDTEKATRGMCGDCAAPIRATIRRNQEYGKKLNAAKIPHYEVRYAI
jgi:hypothetical protein